MINGTVQLGTRCAVRQDCEGMHLGELLPDQTEANSVLAQRISELESSTVQAQDSLLNAVR